jgi:hypothetical protein
MTAQQTSGRLSVAAASRILASVGGSPEQVPRSRPGMPRDRRRRSGPAVQPAMDGYALRAADVAQASRAQPVGLAVVADLATGAVD